MSRRRILAIFFLISISLIASYFTFFFRMERRPKTFKNLDSALVKMESLLKLGPPGWKRLVLEYLSLRDFELSRSEVPVEPMGDEERLEFIYIDLVNEGIFQVMASWLRHHSSLRELKRESQGQLACFTHSYRKGGEPFSISFKRTPKGWVLTGLFRLR